MIVASTVMIFKNILVSTAYVIVGASKIQIYKTAKLYFIFSIPIY
jgi:hypothetical protein